MLYINTQRHKLSTILKDASLVAIGSNFSEILSAHLNSLSKDKALKNKQFGRFRRNSWGISWKGQHLKGRGGNR